MLMSMATNGCKDNSARNQKQHCCFGEQANTVDYSTDGLLDVSGSGTTATQSPLEFSWLCCCMARQKTPCSRQVAWHYKT
jgi:hypothetical protein